MVERAPGERSDEGVIDLHSVEEPLPRQFGKYTLMRRLAAGGMAELFLALHRAVAGFEKLVVIKRIHPSMNSDKGFIEMLLHEARIAATLSHTNIVHIFDVGQIEGRFFIAMEHIHGEDIRSILRAMKKHGITEFPLEHALSIIVGCSAGLAYAHEKRDLHGALLNIVHRDISPQNIVVTFTGDVKVVDFGIAKSRTKAGEETRSGQLKGKVPYMSPEQARGEPIDRRTDVFAAGILLFELTTGKRLFKGASEYETLKLICEKDYPLPSEVRPGYPPALDRIVMKALAKKREERYQSAREMQRDLETFIREERLPVSQVSLMHWMQSLFEEKLSQQQEVLQDMKQLADEVAAQRYSSTGVYDGTMTNGAGMATGSGIVDARRWRGSAPLWLAGAAAVAAAAAAAGGLLYMRERAARMQPPVSVQPGTALQPAPAETRGSLELSTVPEGCAIWFNGELLKETTPATFDGLPIGRELQVKLTKEGLEPYEGTIVLSAATPAKALSVQMSEGSVTLMLKVEPRPLVFLDGEAWKGDPGRIDNVSAGEEHKLVLTAAGYATRTVTFVAQPGETKVVDEKLQKLHTAKPR
jgi:eukaryotic-like serine/threonine-protein kinase